jgi:hypothetical protein
MLREYIVHYTPYAVLGVIALYAVTKLYYMSRRGLKENYVQLLVGSIILFSEQDIKNTFRENLKRYYKSSNKINSFYYTTLIFIAGVYIFMRII